MARRRIGMSTEDFVGGTDAEEPRASPVGATIGQVEEAERDIDESLDPVGLLYRDEDARFGGGKAEGWGRVVRTVFAFDPAAAFERLESPRFRRPPSVMEYGELVDALDECSELVVLASRLAENAKLAAKLYELDLGVVRAPMRKMARAKAAEEKTKGAIAAADVDAALAELFPEEFRRQEENLLRAKGLASHAGELLERWKARAREIDGMVRTARKV